MQYSFNTPLILYTIFQNHTLNFKIKNLILNTGRPTLARLTVAGWPSSPLTIDLTRATHCPVIAPVFNIVIILTIDLAPSCILRVPHPSETCLSINNNVIPFTVIPPSALQLSPDFMEHCITSKTPSTITASSTTSCHPRVTQLRIIIACSRATFSPLPSHRPRPTLVSIRRDSRTFPEHGNRQRYKDSWTHWTLHLHFILCFVYFCHVIHVSIMCYLPYNVATFHFINVSSF